MGPLPQEPDQDDPWDFLPTVRPKPIEGGSRPRRGARLAGGAEDAGAAGQVEDPLSSLLNGSTEVPAADPGQAQEVPGAAGGQLAGKALGLSSADAVASPPARPVAAGPDVRAAASNGQAGSYPGFPGPTGDIAGGVDAGTSPAARGWGPRATVGDESDAAEQTIAGLSAPGHPGRDLRSRARPMAIALAATSLAGLLTEVVGNSQLMTLVGPNSMLVMYPLSGIGLLAVALLGFRDIDARARIRVLRAVNLAFAVLLAGALVLVAADVGRAAAIGVIWLSADQLNFLIPVLIWAAAGDEFNVAEGRRVFGWIIAWTYVGQVTGLVIGTISPGLMSAAGIGLYWLLLADPIICGALGLWLPRALAHTATAPGLARREGMRAALRGALDFVWEIPAWRAFLWASVLTLVAGMSVHLTYTMGVGIVVGDDAGKLQVLFASMNLLALLICWIIARWASEPILERLGIPGTLLVLPIATIVAGLLLAGGAQGASLALMIAGITVWRIPRLSIDESARRAALTLVPDQRRARVSFLIGPGPLGIGLVASGAVAGIGVATGRFWISSLLAALIAAAALPAGILCWRRWDDSLLNWRMRRRKVMRHL